VGESGDPVCRAVCDEKRERGDTHVGQVVHRASRATGKDEPKPRADDDAGGFQAAEGEGSLSFVADHRGCILAGALVIHVFLHARVPKTSSGAKPAELSLNAAVAPGVVIASVAFMTISKDYSVVSTANLNRAQIADPDGNQLTLAQPGPAQAGV
jgi:hypothetical protein